MNEPILNDQHNLFIHPTTLHEVEKRRESSSFPFYCYRLWFGRPDSDLVPLHWHNEMEILYTEAHGILYINDREYPVVPGDILFINPGLLHRTFRRSEGNMYHIVFDLRLLMNSAGHDSVNALIEDWICRKKQVGVFPERDSSLYAGLLPLVKSLTGYADAPIRPGTESCRILSVLFSLLAVFHEENRFIHVEESSLYGMEYVTRILEYIDHNYRNAITVHSLADHIKLSETYIYRLFRDYVGVTPVGYINTVRLREAYLLLESGLTVTETAAEVGFINVSYFIKIFKNATGMTPYQWLKNRKNNSI